MAAPMADPPLSPARRSRTDTRAARKARRAQAPVAPAFITRQLPPYAPFAEEALLAIEAHADQLLEEIGMEIRGDEAALALWQKAGARIREGCRVHVPCGLAREIVRRSAPARVYPARAQSRAQRADRRGTLRLRTRLRSTFRQRPRARPPLRHTRGLQELRQARPTWPPGCITPAARCASRSMCR